MMNPDKVLETGGSRATAWEDIRKAVALEPRSPQLRLRAAFVLWDSGNVGAALKQCESAIRLDPGSAGAYGLKSDLQSSLGLKGPAWDSLRKGIMLDPQSALLRVSAAHVLKDLGKVKAALEQAQEAIRLDPKLARAYEMKSDLELEVGLRCPAWQSLRKAIELEPKSSHLRVKAADLLMALGDLGPAWDRCQEALRLDPRSSAAYARKYCLELLLGRSASAGMLLRRAVALDPSSARVRMSGMSILEEVLWKKKAALRQADSALRLEPRSFGLRMQVAEVLDHFGDFKLAMKQLRQAISLNPMSKEAHAQLARLHLWHGDFMKAIRHADRALAIDPAAGDAYRIRGAAAVLRKKYERALADLDEAIGLNQKDAESYIWRAETKRQLEDFRGSMGDLRKARRLWPNSLGVCVNQALTELARDGSTGLIETVASLAGRLMGRPMLRLRLKDPRRTGFLLKRVLEAMKGNRSIITTYVQSVGGRPRLRKYIDYHGLAQRERIFGKLRPGDPDRAFKELDGLLDEKGAEDRGLLHSYRGELNLWLGHYAAARRDFEAALCLDPDLHLPQVGLTGVHVMSGDFRQALRHMESAVSGGVPQYKFWIWRGEALRKSGNVAAALCELEKHARSLSWNPSALLNLGLTCDSLAKYGKSRKLFNLLHESAYGLIMDAALEAGLAAEIGGEKEWTAPAIRVVFEKGLEMMKGNRTYWMCTYVVATGRVKCIRAYHRYKVNWDDRL